MSYVLFTLSANTDLNRCKWIMYVVNSPPITHVVLKEEILYVQRNLKKCVT